jgi:hypothetical protein
MPPDFIRGTKLAAAWPALIYPYDAAYARPTLAPLFLIAALAAALLGVWLGRRRYVPVAFVWPVLGFLAALHLAGTQLAALEIKSAQERWRVRAMQDKCGVQEGMTHGQVDALIQVCARVALKDDQGYSLQPLGLARLRPEDPKIYRLRVGFDTHDRVLQVESSEE